MSVKCPIGESIPPLLTFLSSVNYNYCALGRGALPCLALLTIESWCGPAQELHQMNESHLIGWLARQKAPESVFSSWHCTHEYILTEWSRGEAVVKPWRLHTLHYCKPQRSSRVPQTEMLTPEMWVSCLPACLPALASRQCCIHESWLEKGIWGNYKLAPDLGPAGLQSLLLIICSSSSSPLSSFAAILKSSRIEGGTFGCHLRRWIIIRV